MAEETLSGINPTRMELLKLKDREQLAVKGHSLLKEKRDALIKEFFDILDEVQGARDDLNKELAEAFDDLTAAQIEMGDLAVQKAALSVTESMDIDIKSRNIMGVSVPVVNMDAHDRTLVDRGYGLTDTSMRLDEAAKKFEHCLKLSIQLGEIEKTIYLLAAEIEATKRRVNALEHIMIPKIKATIKSIDMRLQEMERENFVRLKMIRAVIEESGAADESEATEVKKQPKKEVAIKTESKPESKTEVKSEPVVESKPESKTEVKSETTEESKPEPETITKAKETTDKVIKSGKSRVEAAFEKIKARMERK